MDIYQLVNSELPDEEAESLMFLRLRSLDETWKLSYGEVGLICQAVQTRLLWKHRPDPETGERCTSFTRWVLCAAPWSYATVFAAKRDVEELLPDVGAEDIAQIPASNFTVMRQLSTGVRSSPEVVEAAKTKRTEELVEQIRRDHPNEHLEQRKLMRFSPTETQAADIEEAIALAMEQGAMSRTEALWGIAIDYKASNMLEELQKAEQ